MWYFGFYPITDYLVNTPGNTEQGFTVPQLLKLDINTLSNSDLFDFILFELEKSSNHCDQPNIKVEMFKSTLKSKQIKLTKENTI